MEGRPTSTSNLSSSLPILSATDLAVEYLLDLLQSDTSSKPHSLLNSHNLGKLLQTARIAGKVVTDFSGLLTKRMPCGFSGGLYSLNQRSVQIGVLVSVWLYNEHAEEVEGKLDRDTTWGMAVTVASLWTVLNIYFLGRVAVPKYRRLFWSFESGWQLLERQFFSREGDDKMRVRVNLFNDNIFTWKGIEKEVKEWTMGSWEKWVGEKPDWFDEQVISTIPDKFIPARELLELGGAGRSRRGQFASFRVLESFRAIVPVGGS